MLRLIATTYCFNIIIVRGLVYYTMSFILFKAHRS